MNKDLNFVLLQHGLLKLGAQNDMVKMAYGALLRTLPGLVRAGARYLPSRGIQGVQGTGRGIARWFSNLGKAKPPVPAPGSVTIPGQPPVISIPSGGLGGIGKAKDFLKARQAFQGAKADTAKAWNELNPLARGVIKYPAQFAAGYAAGIPMGATGWAGFMAGNLKDQVNAGKEGARQALAGVDQQLAQYQDQLQNMGMMDRLGLAAGVAFKPDMIPGFLGGARGELQSQIEKLTGKPYQPVSAQPPKS